MKIPLCDLITNAVAVHWTCGLAIGPPEWVGTDAYMSPECPGEGMFYAEMEWLLPVEMSCTECGQALEPL